MLPCCAGSCCSTRSHAADKKEAPQTSWRASFLCRWWGSNPHVLLAQGILSFGESFPFGVIWCPTLKRKSNSTSNEFLINLRFFDAFSLYSVFSIWIAQMEIGGMFRRDAEPVIQDCAHRLFSFFGKYFKPVQFRGRLIRIQNEATKPGAHPSSDTQ